MRLLKAVYLFYILLLCVTFSSCVQQPLVFSTNYTFSGTVNSTKYGQSSFNTTRSNVSSVMTTNIPSGELRINITAGISADIYSFNSKKVYGWLTYSTRDSLATLQNSLLTVTLSNQQQQLINGTFYCTFVAGTDTVTITNGSFVIHFYAVSAQ